MSIIRTAAVAVLLMFLSVWPATACQMAGPNAHIGVVTALDQKSLTLKDAESGMDLRFLATPEVLKGLAVKDRVTVTFEPQGDKLIAKAVKKG